ncbi:IS6 family transposase [Streptomyces sp. NBC_01728]|nr:MULTISPECIES: IS6 family transposase [unclassified Streptomyces]MCX4460113.1 IS6 family transposase [Streptomyces sp. NBC_01719]MCX4500556.1 IS6 family transposase [Streptomyces sp. NBC_01728]
MDAGSPSYKGFRYPAEIVAYCVWLYHRFPLSFREVEELMLARGVIVSYETIRQWCAKFGPAYAAGLRRRKPRAGDKWHLDEVFVKINGERRYLWRAVDQDGNVLDVLVQSRRDAKAARRFMAKLMKKQCRVPRALVTDKLRSYGVAHRSPCSPLQTLAAARRTAKAPADMHGTTCQRQPSSRGIGQAIISTPSLLLVVAACLRCWKGARGGQGSEPAIKVPVSISAAHHRHASSRTSPRSCQQSAGRTRQTSRPLSFVHWSGQKALT